ncbi:MAG: hypothetical protein NZ528_05425 [Caldilineales bacterium]|nr:hypothetical protein [Caldilineales bacterium]MDW8317962.1 hypothetical protein [Anaerolineae bacterium]
MTDQTTTPADHPDQPPAAEAPLQVVYVPVLIAGSAPDSVYQSQREDQLVAWPLATLVAPTVL